MKRIVSLLPSLTETACALGLGERLVGRSHECDHPPDVVASLAVCTEPKFDPEGKSREIDERVRRLVREGLSVYRVHAERLRDLHPDVILTQDHCEVCAASLRDVEDAVGSFVGGAPRVVSVAPSTLAGVWDSVRTIAGACGVAERGDALVGRLTARISTLGEQTGALARPSVVCIEWLEPLMTGGNWMPELIALAGGRSLLAETGAHSPWTDWDAIRAANPDVLLVIPCGFDLARTREELALLTGRPGFSDLRAVREGRVFLADGNAYYNRPGPRLVESAEILAEMLHPEAFEPAREGEAWARVAT